MDSEVKDVALIAATQKVEHYEIASYGCAKTSLYTTKLIWNADYADVTDFR